MLRLLRLLRSDRAEEFLSLLLVSKICRIKKSENRKEVGVGVECGEGERSQQFLANNK